MKALERSEKQAARKATLAASAEKTVAKKASVPRKPRKRAASGEIASDSNSGLSLDGAMGGLSGDGPGVFVLENARGQVVRSFRWESPRIAVVYREDNKRIETFGSTSELDEAGIPYVLLANASQAEIKKSSVSIGKSTGFRGQVRWISEASQFSKSFELASEDNQEFKRIVGFASAAQLGLVGLVLVVGALIGKNKGPEHEVTLLPQDVVEKMLAEEHMTAPPKQETPKAEPRQAHQAPPVQSHGKVVVAPSLTKIAKNAPIPRRSTSFKKTAHVATTQTHGPRAGGYKSEGKRGYGTDERYMNQIAALGALDNAAHAKGGNGGRGGLNLQAVGTEAGSGAGGKGYGGFGSNGGGGKGLGGIGTGKGMGLSNSMYGKGLIAAPFGDGSPAPGAGGYGTRGRAGGGAQGAGYGSMTIVGSWKGTGPKGDGPAGSGAGNGGAGSPWGSADGDDDDAVVTGGLDMDAIKDVILRNQGQITYCYEQGLQRQPGLAGRVTLRFQIGARGRVDVSRVAHSSLHSAQVESCIAGKVHGWVFPKPQGGVSVAVTYPWNLRRVTQR